MSVLAEIDAEPGTLANDVRLAHLNQRGTDVKPPSFDAGFRGDRRQVLEGCDEGGPAVGVPRIVEVVYADEKIEGTDHFRPAQGKRKKQGISRGDVSHRNTRLHTFRDGDAAVGQRGAADLRQIDAHDTMFFCAKRRGNTRCRVQFGAVPLSIFDAERVALVALRAGNCQHGGRIEAAGQ